MPRVGRGARWPFARKALARARKTGAAMPHRSRVESGETLLLDRHSHQIPVLGPASVVVRDLVVPEQVLECDPRPPLPPPHPAPRDRGLLWIPPPSLPPD